MGEDVFALLVAFIWVYLPIALAGAILWMVDRKEERDKL